MGFSIASANYFFNILLFLQLNDFIILLASEGEKCVEDFPHPRNSCDHQALTGSTSLNFFMCVF